MTQPIDTYFPLQWHLQNNGQTGGRPGVDLNVLPAWTYYRGSGVRVGVYDDGTFVLHPDLIGNWDPGLQPIVDGLPFNPNPLTYRFGDGTSAHGTAVAGLIVAGWNGFGVVGVAPEARFGAGIAVPGVRLDERTWPIFEEQLRQQYAQLGLFDVVNHSYGREPFDITSWEDNKDRFLFDEASRTGRGDLGGIQVIAAGNARSKGAFTTADLLSNMRQHVTVAAGSDLGDIIRYSTAGPSLLVTAPVDVNPLLGPPVTSPDRKLFKSTTTDIPGINFGFSGEGLAGLDSSLGPNFRYTTMMNGTSAAAPMVSGVVALMLEANPALGYRDVQDILAISARAPWQQGEFELYPWQTNGAQAINGGGFRYSHDYGFGFVDAAAAVRLADSWQHQRTAANELRITSGVINLDAPIPADGANPFYFDINIETDITVEWLELHTSFDHSHWGDLTLTLTSPTGSQHVLLNRIGQSPEFISTLNAASYLGDDDQKWLDKFGATGLPGGYRTEDTFFNELSWPFTSTVSRGESSAGTWTLSINGLIPQHGGAGGSGVLNGVELRLYGRPTAGSPGAEQPTLYFTDSYAPLLELETERGAIHSSTTPLALNAAASSLDLRVDLRQGTATLGDAPILWDDTTVVDAVFAGAGNDLITGSARDQRIDGGWGDDLIIYGGGHDVWSGGFGADAFRFDASLLRRSVFETGANRVDILDFTPGIDRIELSSGQSRKHFQLGDIDGNSAQLLWSGWGANRYPFRSSATGMVELINTNGAWDPSHFMPV